MTLRRKLALAAAFGSLVAFGVVVSSATATHEVPQSAPSLHSNLVPAFKQCGTGGNPTTGQHSLPLAVGSCVPKPASAQARVGPGNVGAANIDVITGDVSLTGTDNDVRTPTGADYDPTTGTDLFATARIQFTDHYNCFPAPCTGPYTSPGTGTQLDFGPVPISCVANGSATSAPGSDCNVTTSANTVVPGSVVPGKQAVVQIFRIRISDYQNVLFQQQGIFIP
jgi:hypothetical protein